jgi:hypothetical protein
VSAMPASQPSLPGGGPARRQSASTSPRPRVLRPTPPPGESNRLDDNRQRYVIASAAITTAGQLLKHLHAVAGAPHVATSLEDLPLLRAAAQARTAAGAMSVVAGRLLTLVRDNDQKELPDLAAPARSQTGVTVPDFPDEEWRTTVRSLASAAAECDAALASCRAAAADPRVVEALTHLQDLAGMTVDLLDRSPS